MSIRRLSLRTPLAIVAAALVALAPPAHADSLQDIGRLMKQAQYSQALDKVEQYLSSNAKDPQGRFLKGLILTELNRQAEAIVVFTKLTEEFPESPEPYNNLAVIYAQQKQYDKARQALEMAIRTHPSYATAHENLGDIYAHMASQAYDKALLIDSSNASAQTKLSMIRDMMTGGGRTSPIAGGTRPTAKPVPAPIAAATPPQPTTTSPAATATSPVATASPSPKASPAESSPAAAGDSEIASTIEAWAAAWSKKNVKVYLSYYAKDFDPPKGESRSSWESERHKRIAKPGSIQVSVDNVKVTTEGADRATARFRQHYQSATLKTSGNKVLSLVKRDGKWQIKQERV
ncbi:MAG: hypothetical protein RL695_2355, partial [Pseudomonadota bacterium]